MKAAVKSKGDLSERYDLRDPAMGIAVHPECAAG